MAKPVNLLNLGTRENIHNTNLGIGKTFDIIEALSFMDLNRWDDDFQGDTLHGGYQSTASGAGSAAAAIDTGKLGGQIVLVSGTDDNGRSDLSIGRHYTGEQGALLVARVKISAITTYKLEIGFTDVISGTDAGAVNNATTPTFTADDFCGVVADTDNAGGATLVLLGVAATVAAARVDTAFTPTAAAFFTVAIALQDTTMHAVIMNASHEVMYRGSLALAITKTVLLTPWLFVQARAGSATRDLSVDKLHVRQHIYT